MFKTIVGIPLSSSIFPLHLPHQGAPLRRIVSAGSRAAYTRAQARRYEAGTGIVISAAGLCQLAAIIRN
jgi:hypothetical protein